MEHIIPALDSPYSWTQPDRKDILIGDDTAIMTQHDYNLLYEYSDSKPSGVYPGKMWRLHASDRQDYLCWYALVPGQDNRVVVHVRKIVIGDWKALFGATEQPTATAIRNKTILVSTPIHRPGSLFDLTQT